jgi:hypothetical protein
MAIQNKATSTCKCSASVRSSNLKYYRDSEVGG